MKIAVLLPTLLLSTLALVAVTLPLQAQEAAKKAPNQPQGDVSFEYRFADDLQQTADSIARKDLWFRDAKFGAFIHFGVYSMLEGEYNGTVPGHRYAEWIQVSANMSSDVAMAG